MPKKVQLYTSDDVIENFYKVLLSDRPDEMQWVHIPKSDVFYVRQAIYNNTGEWYTLDHVERAMYLEGHLARHEVFEPDRKRPYADAPEAWLQERVQQLPRYCWAEKEESLS